MPLRRMAWWAAFAMLFCTSAVSQSYDSEFDEKPWAEQQTQLPSFPKAENLVVVRLESMASFEMAVDITSVDIGQDGVIRYVLVAKSRSGSENVTFEGIRCELRQRKLYAVGRSDKTWAQVRNVSWTAYGTNSRSYPYELAKEYFCPDFKSGMKVADIIVNIRRGGNRVMARPDSAD